MTDLKAVLDLVKNTEGKINMGKGKLYSTVATRVEALRLITGDDYSIETELLRVDPDEYSEGAPTLTMKCTIRDRAGRVVATGHAEETRGANWINETSALEACETSAIGRALAALGIHGGEFASLNEIEAANRKRASSTSASAGGVAGAPPQGPAGKDAPQSPSPVIAIPILQEGWPTAVEAFRKFAEECADKPALEQFWTRNRKTIDDMRETAPWAFDEVKEVFSKRASALSSPKDKEG